MARAKRHYISNKIWHITQRCHKREFLLKFKTVSIGVGGSPFIERIKKAIRAMAKGRCVLPGDGAFELREAQSVYNAIFDHKNGDIGPK